MAAVKADLAPVRPLAAPWRRAGPVTFWAAAAFAAVLALLGPRSDWAVLGMPLTFGASSVAVAAGLGLVVLALAKAVPGRGAATLTLASGAAAGLALAALVASLTRLASPGVRVADPLLTKGPACFAIHVLIGLSALALVAALVFRARPVRAAGALALGGLGAALMAEGLYRLHCGISDLRHVGVWHGGAVLAVALAGLAAGSWWDRRAERQMEERLAAPR
jgi:hypothetical protein